METSHQELLEEFPDVLTVTNIRAFAKEFKGRSPKAPHTKNMRELATLLKAKRSASATTLLGKQWSQRGDRKLEVLGLDILIDGVTVTVQLKPGNILSMKLPKRSFTLGFASIVFGMGKSSTWDRPELKTNKSQLTALVISTTQQTHNIEFIPRT
jgi:hypothetical protein